MLRTQGLWYRGNLISKQNNTTIYFQVVKSYFNGPVPEIREIIDWLIKEGGSTRVKAEVENQITQGIMKESASFPTRSHGYIYDSIIPGKESRAYRKPLGVIGVISPWNFPMNLSMRSVAPAIATGNTVVLKPASSTPVTGATLTAKIFEEAGLPKGVPNVVVGKGSSIGDDFVKHPIPNHISSTGSTPVGRNIGKIAGENLKEVSLELGGNNIFVVMEDADIDLALKAAAFGKFMNQGQICMSVNRFVVHENVADEFVEKFVKATGKLKYGNPAEEAVLVGPLIDHDQVERILKDIKASTSAGATIKIGGKAEGNVLEPTNPNSFEFAIFRASSSVEYLRIGATGPRDYSPFA